MVKIPTIQSRNNNKNGLRLMESYEKPEYLSTKMYFITLIYYGEAIINATRKNSCSSIQYNHNVPDPSILTRVHFISYLSRTNKSGATHTGKQKITDSCSENKRQQTLQPQHQNATIHLSSDVQLWHYSPKHYALNYLQQNFNLFR